MKRREERRANGEVKEKEKEKEEEDVRISDEEGGPIRNNNQKRIRVNRSTRGEGEVHSYGEQYIRRRKEGVREEGEWGGMLMDFTREKKEKEKVRGEKKEGGEEREREGGRRRRRAP